eukprot:4166672-Prymnesium_polylepis.1
MSSIDGRLTAALPRPAPRRTFDAPPFRARVRLQHGPRRVLAARLQHGERAARSGLDAHCGALPAVPGKPGRGSLER